MSDLIITEKSNPASENIDIVSTVEMLQIINNEDAKIAKKVAEEIENIAKAVDVTAKNVLNGGRLLYFGAGTSGRLGVLDASECPPTFNTDPETVKGIIAGGDTALRNAIEGAEDNAGLALDDFSALNVTENDTVVAISASGNAAYVIEILKLAKGKKAAAVALTCNPEAKMSKYADIVICVETGAEVISGSTRMKAGTAQKLVLNMLSTGVMIKTGKVYKNFMVDVKATNIKLKDRAVRIVSEIAKCDKQTAQSVLANSNRSVKPSIVQILKNVSLNEAETLLKNANGVLRRVI